MAMLSKCFQRTVPFFFASRFSLRPQRRSVSEMEKAFFPLRKCTVFIFRKNRLRSPLWGSWGRAAPKSCGRRRETALAKRNRKGCATTAKHRKIALGLQMQGGGVKPVFVTGERRQRSRCQSGDRFCGFAVPLSSAYWRLAAPESCGRRLETGGAFLASFFRRRKKGGYKADAVRPKRRTQTTQRVTK